jgi:hypothetical protein
VRCPLCRAYCPSVDGEFPADLRVLRQALRASPGGGLEADRDQRLGEALAGALGTGRAGDHTWWNAVRALVVPELLLPLWRAGVPEPDVLRRLARVLLTARACARSWWGPAVADPAAAAARPNDHLLLAATVAVECGAPDHDPLSPVLARLRAVTVGLPRPEPAPLDMPWSDVVRDRAPLFAPAPSPPPHPHPRMGSVDGAGL